MSFSSQKGGTVLSEINVTPLVDVMLVLLIIFMVTAPFIQHGIKVNLPQAQTTSMDTKEEDLIISITKENKYFIQDEPFEFEEFKEKLANLNKSRKDKTVYLNADRNLKYDIVVKAMAVIKNSGFEEMGLITDPETLKVK